jgi:DNA-binding MarR family transcriptional regulator
LAQRRVQQASASERNGVSSAQAGALFLLGAREGMLIGDVARALGVGAAAISGLVDRMEAAGLVQRTPAPEDGRAVRLVLTDRGREARERAKARAATVNQRLTQGFSDDELDVVARWLAAAAERFAKEIDE